ncbi:40S ribosomal protein S27 [Anthophora quadrimaculata]
MLRNTNIIIMPLAKDFLHPSPAEEKRKHKLKRLKSVECDGCRTILCTSTGGKARLTEGCSFRRKVQC